MHARMHMPGRWAGPCRGHVLGQDAPLQLYLNLGSPASSEEFVASNVGTPEPLMPSVSGRQEFDVAIDTPLQGRFYYVAIVSEKSEMVRVSVELAPKADGALSPIGAVFVSVCVQACVPACVRAGVRAGGWVGGCAGGQAGRLAHLISYLYPSLLSADYCAAIVLVFAVAAGWDHGDDWAQRLCRLNVRHPDAMLAHQA